MRGWNEGPLGYTLLELVATVCVAGVLCALAVPRLDAMLAQMQVRAAAGRLAGDLAHARTTAIRRGRDVVLVLDPAPECAVRFRGRRAGWRYRVGTRGEAGKRTDLRLAGGRVCMEMNGGDSLVITARGLPRGFTNRTFWMTQGRFVDSLTLSAVGRVRRVD